MKLDEFVVGNKYKCVLPNSNNTLGIYPMLGNEIYECTLVDVYNIPRLKGLINPLYLKNTTYYVEGDEIEVSYWSIFFEPLDSKNSNNLIYLNSYPHKCPKCGSPAYIGLHSVDCSNCNK